MKTTRIVTRAALLCFVLIVVLAVVGCGIRTTPFTLTLVHNSDGESAILADDYSGSVAQFASVVQQIRDEAGVDNTLVVSSGDNFLAGLEYAASQGRYDAQVLNLAGVEVSAIGNHEFDFGPQGLRRFAEEADFALISSNLDFSAEAELADLFGEGLKDSNQRESGKRIFPYALFKKAGNTIGVVGATTETIRVISSPGQTIIKPARESLQEQVDLLTKRGVKVIIALTHMQNIEIEKELAQQIEGVDIFVAGGGDDLIGNSHNRYLVRANREGDLVPDTPTGGYPFMTTSASGEPVAVVSTDGSYNYVGKLVVSFDGNGIISEVDIDNSGPQPVTLEIAPDPIVDAEVVQPVAQRLEEFKIEVVGETLSGLDGTRELVRTQETTMGNAITDGYLYSTNTLYGAAVDFSFTNGGGIRRNVVVPANGQVTKLDILTALPFSNYLTIVRDLTVSDIAAIFNRSVSELPEAGGQFLQVSGIQVRYDSSRPPGERVRTISVGGTVIYEEGEARTDQRFSAVTNSFLASGGDDYGVLATIPREQVENIGISYAEGFERYLQDNSPLQSDREGRLVDIAR